MEYLNKAIEVKIKTAKKNKAKKLDFSNQNVLKIPSEIFEIITLEHLILDNCHIQEIPSKIQKLVNLKSLSLTDNNLKKLPKSISKLKELKSLSISKNHLEEFPNEILELKNLRILDLSHNGIRSIPIQIYKLKNLKNIDLTQNHITKLPDTFYELNKLEYLYLGYNFLEKIEEEVVNLKNLKEIFLYSNNLKSLPKNLGKLNKLDNLIVDENPFDDIPIEILRQSFASLKNYLNSLENEEVLFEAKLLIVGAGNVGKTCLVKRLVYNETVNLNESTTEGIDIKKWFVKTKLSDRFRINIWDFGGQEIYHATHQFFLTKRSLYILAWEARTDDNLINFDYWLNVIKLLSDHAPVMVVLNKIDERVKLIEEKELQNKFKNIVSFHKVSALNGDGIKELTKEIRERIVTLSNIGDKLPKVWNDIRLKLEDIDNNYISYNEYLDICSEFDLNKEKADFLSTYLHDLGLFLNFRSNPLLRNILILKPEWATNAVYKIIDTRKIQENFGKFHFNDLKKIWLDYPEDKFEYLLELMKKFELCYQLPNSYSYVIPELLRPDKPDFKWNYTDNLRFEYHYDFMPAGIISRFIVRTDDLIKEEISWKYGVVLKNELSEAIVRSEPINRKIKIYIKGIDKKGLLEIIRREFNKIHSRLNNPNVKEMVQCICDECQNSDKPYFHEYNDLVRATHKNKTKIECKKSFNRIPIDSLFKNIEKTDIESKIDQLIKILLSERKPTDSNEVIIKKASDFLILQPNFFGVGVNFNKIIEKVSEKIRAIK